MSVELQVLELPSSDFGLTPGRAKRFRRIVGSTIASAFEEKSFEAVPSVWDRFWLFGHAKLLQQTIVEYGERNRLDLQTFLIERDNFSESSRKLGFLAIEVIERAGVKVQERITEHSDSPFANPAAAHAHPPLNDLPQWQVSQPEDYRSLIRIH